MSCRTMQTDNVVGDLRDVRGKPSFHLSTLIWPLSGSLLGLQESTSAHSNFYTIHSIAERPNCEQITHGKVKFGMFIFLCVISRIHNSFSFLCVISRIHNSFSFLLVQPSDASYSV